MEQVISFRTGNSHNGYGKQQIISLLVFMKEGESKRYVDFQWDRNVKISQEIYLIMRNKDVLLKELTLVFIFNHSINVFDFSAVKVKNTKKL